LTMESVALQNSPRKSPSKGVRKPFQLYRPPNMRKNDILTKSMENIEDTPSSTVTKAEKKAELNETETVVQFRRSKTVGKSSNRLSVPCFFPASAASASAAAELKGNGTVIPKEAPLQSVIAKRCHASVKDLSKRKELNDADFKKIEEFFNSLHLAGDKNVASFLNSKCSSAEHACAIGQVLIKLAIENGKKKSTIAKLCHLLLRSASSNEFRKGLVAGCNQYFERRHKLRTEFVTYWHEFITFLSELCSDSSFTSESDLVNVVFRVFNYLLVPPVLDAIKMEELECIISSLLNAGYSLERQYPDRLIDLRNTFRNAFLDAKEPWVRKMILLLIELSAGSWRLSEDANRYYFQTNTPVIIMYHQLFHLIIYCGHISTTSCLLMFHNKFKPCFNQICSNILFNVLKRSMYIQVMETPNPHSLKFLPGIPVLPGRTAEFPNRPSAENSPLARAIFRIKGVKSVFFGEDFITVTKNSEVKDWVTMKPEIFSTIMDFFTSKQDIIIDDSTEKDAADDDNDTVAMIKDLLNTRIRPTVQDDGGDVVFMVVDEVEEIAEKEFQKIAVVMNVREEIEALQNPFPGNFDDSDSDDVTKAQLVPFSTEEELVTETVSKFSRIRAANLKLLDEENPRYKGEVVNRSQLEQFTNSDEETASSSATDVSEEMDINQESDNMIHTFSRVDLLDQKERGIAVQQQLKLWEQMLSLKIRFQKLLQSANRLPQSADYREKLLQSDDELLETFSSARRSVQKLNEALEKWYQRTRLGGIGVSAKKDFSAFESNAVAQIAQILTDRKRLIQRTQLKRLEYDIIGKEEKCADEDRNVNIFDDSDFHEQLLREFIQKRMNDITDPVLLGRHWSKFQKLRDKSKKSKVDRKASKGRRIRIQVMSKLVNFMAPVDKSKMTNETRTSETVYVMLYQLACSTQSMRRIFDSCLQARVTSAAADKSLPREKFDQFKKWFWSVVSSMTADEKQDLIYFWTGSPTLAPSMERLKPTPNNDMYLPTANTCFSRLYIPLYSSKNILRQKLFFAIKIKTFGFV
ncbi:NFU1 iron-sulfur cluster scaffold -like protein, mitochondrial, partial [Trichinella spiralis]